MTRKPPFARFLADSQRTPTLWWLYRFPSGRSASVVPDLHQPFRWEAVDDQTTPPLRRQPVMDFNKTPTPQEGDVIEIEADHLPGRFRIDRVCGYSEGEGWGVELVELADADFRRFFICLHEDYIGRPWWQVVDADQTRPADGWLTRMRSMFAPAADVAQP